jgi:hypothetical protein
VLDLGATAQRVAAFELVTGTVQSGEFDGEQLWLVSPGW